jgi:hypothetical protein
MDYSLAIERAHMSDHLLVVPHRPLRQRVEEVVLLDRPEAEHHPPPQLPQH